MMKSKTAQIVFHIVGCLLFLTLPIIFMPGPNDLDDFFRDSRPLRESMHNILILIFFYLNFYLFIPKLYFKKKYLYFGLAVVVCFLIVAFLPGQLLPFEEMRPDRHGPGPDPRGSRFMFTLGHNVFFFLAVMFFSLMLKINLRLKQSEKEKMRAELSYLKAQINPHFLFNSLNTIYSLAIQKADNTAEAIVKLSGMMRFVITDASHDHVSIEKEISYITDYIEFQKIRHGETVKVDYQTQNIFPGERIAPLLLMPFIENAFKFGINPEEDSIIRISIIISGTELHLHVYNLKVGKTLDPGHAGGIGISNARHRLELLYPDKHQLLINDGELDYTVDLYINLK
jgi:hypothetical protein